MQSTSFKSKAFPWWLTVVALFLGASGGLMARPYAYQVTGGSTISVFGTATRQETGAIGVGGSPSDIAIGPGGRRIYASAENTSGSGCGVFAANTSTRAVTAWQHSLCFTSRLVVSPEGGLVYAVHNFDGGVDFLNAETLEVAGTIPGATRSELLELFGLAVRQSRRRMQPPAFQRVLTPSRNGG